MGVGSTKDASTLSYSTRGRVSLFGGLSTTANSQAARRLDPPAVEGQDDLCLTVRGHDDPAYAPVSFPLHQMKTSLSDWNMTASLSFKQPTLDSNPENKPRTEAALFISGAHTGCIVVWVPSDGLHRGQVGRAPGRGWGGGNRGGMKTSGSSEESPHDWTL